MKLVIDRNIWLRGESYMKSRLLRESDGKQCCLGILAEAVGVPKECLMEKTTPAGIRDESAKKFPKGILAFSKDCSCHENTSLTSSLMVVNDSISLSEKEREETLIRLFAQADVQVEFIN